jgi:hypothetical protein
MATGRIVYHRSGDPTYFVGDVEVTKEQYDLRFPNKLDLSEPAMVAAPGIWPMESVALAVHPAQVEEANARAKRHGIAVAYKPDGTCVIADRKARKELNRLEGFHDKQGGYGD